MRLRLSKISIVVFAVMFVISTSLLSIAGDYWPWYLIMAIFAIVPIMAGPNRYRIIGAGAMLLSLSLIYSDIQAGKALRAKHPEFFRR